MGFRFTDLFSLSCSVLFSITTQTWCNLAYFDRISTPERTKNTSVRATSGELLTRTSWRMGSATKRLGCVLLLQKGRRRRRRRRSDLIRPTLNRTGTETSNKCVCVCVHHQNSSFPPGVSGKGARSLSLVDSLARFRLSLSLRGGCFCMNVDVSIVGDWSPLDYCKDNDQGCQGLGN